jgi:hypothetical protein
MADEKARCGRRTRTGHPCKGWPVHGAPGAPCRAHGGNAPHVNAYHAIRGDLLRWKAGTPLVDPGETLLRLVTQSWQRADQLTHRLDQLVDEHGGDLALAMVGDTIILDPQNGREVKSGEYIRGLAQLDAAERERCANWSAKAIAAGLAKRQLELAQQQGRLIADVLRVVLADEQLGLTLEQRRAIPDVGRRVLSLVG